jgi:hypothetical protein
MTSHSPPQVPNEHSVSIVDLAACDRADAAFSAGERPCGEGYGRTRQGRLLSKTHPWTRYCMPTASSRSDSALCR